MSIRVALTCEWVSNTMARHRFGLGEWWYAQRIVGFDPLVEVFAARSVEPLVKRRAS